MNVGKPLGLAYTGADKAEIDQKLNDAVLDVLRRTRCYQAFATEALTSGTWQYTTSASALTVLKVYTTTTTGSSNFPLERMGVDELIDLQSSGTSTSSSPIGFYAMAGASTMLVYPTPSAADTLNLLYVPLPTAMSSSTHDPSNTTYGGIPSQWHYGLELYALWKMADASDDQSSSQGERYRIQYEGDDGRGGYLARMRVELNRNGGQAPRARVGRMRRLGGTNDTYSSWYG